MEQRVNRGKESNLDCHAAQPSTGGATLSQERKPFGLERQDGQRNSESDCGDEEATQQHEQALASHIAPLICCLRAAERSIAKGILQDRIPKSLIHRYAYGQHQRCALRIARHSTKACIIYRCGVESCLRERSPGVSHRRRAEMVRVWIHEQSVGDYFDEIVADGDTDASR